MQTELKPIDTLYKGNYFRSRLEAKWAVFFDELGVEFEYEKEGFNLHYSGLYLPDFYLPQYRCYIEIKPPRESNGTLSAIVGLDVFKKCIELSMAKQKDVWLIFGSPYDQSCLCYEDGTSIYRPSRICFERDIKSLEYAIRPDIFRDEIDEYGCVSLAERPIEEYIHADAAIKSIKYRFEHRR